MVTGVEAAGLVLGSIPLVLAGLEFYAKGIATTKRYWKYKAEFKSLINELRTENVMCINSIEILLTGVVRQKDMADFLANPCGEKWKDAEFERKLKDRLGPTYEPYVETINQMNDVAGAFRDRLKLDRTGKPQFKEEKAFKEHYKRLKFSLNKWDYSDLMSRLRQANVSLCRMTNQALSLEHLRNSRTKTDAIPKFNVIHDRVKGLYSALCSGWKCSCHADHSIGLRLEPRMGDDSSDEDEDEDGDDSPSIRGPFRVFFRYNHHHSEDTGSLTAPWAWEEADVHITSESQSASQPSLKPGVKGGMKGVRFANQTKKVVKTTLDPKPDMQPIQDLCTAIRTFQKPQRDVCLSLLATEYAERKYGILIYPLKQLRAELNMWSISSLRNALMDSKFTRHDRLRLAVTLASSVLQLHETPWLQDDWGKDNIFFISRADKIMYEHPFVSQYFSPVGEKPRRNPVATSMSRIIRNQTLYALGVSLIELWYRKPLQELYRPDDGPLGSEDPFTSAMTEWNTANRLVDELYDDAGEKYSSAVRRCIRCDFDHRASSLEDDEFQKAVYRGVVAQLKENFEFLFD